MAYAFASSAHGRDVGVWVGCAHRNGRRDRGHEGGGGGWRTARGRTLVPEERVSLAAALHTYTLDPALAAGEGRVQGEARARLPGRSRGAVG